MGRGFEAVGVRKKEREALRQVALITFDALLGPLVELGQPGLGPLQGRAIYAVAERKQEPVAALHREKAPPAVERRPVVQADRPLETERSAPGDGLQENAAGCVFAGSSPAAPASS